jgi:hypothetical protein
MNSFLALPFPDKVLLLRAASLLVAVRLALPFASAERLRRWADRPGAGRRPAGRIVWAVQAMARRLGGTTCLAAALALQRLLAANGHACELHIGVARKAQGLAAHAWVVRDGEVLVGELGGDEHYAPLLVWRSGQP